MYRIAVPNAHSCRYSDQLSCPFREPWCARGGCAGTPIYLNAVNLGEIVYSAKRAFGDQKKIEVLAHVERLGFRILPVSNDLVFRAAEYKASFSMSFADCFALASAVEHGAVLVTGDPEFRAVGHLVTIAWV
jgi:ribonuclease VapC